MGSRQSFATPHSRIPSAMIGKYTLKPDTHSNRDTGLRSQPGLHFERKSTAYTQTILRTWGAFSRPPMPIYAAGIAQVPTVNTPTIRSLLRVDAGLLLAQAFTLNIK